MRLSSPQLTVHVPEKPLWMLHIKQNIIYINMDNSFSQTSYYQIKTFASPSYNFLHEEFVSAAKGTSC